MNIYKKLKGVISFFHPRKKIFIPLGKKYDLIIYDNFFPYPSTGFRIDEFTFLLSEIPNSKVIIDFEDQFQPDASYRTSMKKHVSDYLLKHPELSRSQLCFPDKINNINASVLYVAFYFTMLKILKFIEIFRMRFILELYPGGGLVFNNTSVDYNLKRILGWNLCQAVIVNQVSTKDYLIEKKFVILIK